MLRLSTLFTFGAAMLLGVSPARAENERTARNSIYAEGLGPGLAYSVNYERMVHDQIGVRVGLSYLSVSASASAGESSSSSSASWLTFPITASWIGLSTGTHSLELGAGATLTYASASASTLGASASGSGMTAYATTLIGYRLQPPGGGFQFRVGACALIGEGLSLSSEDPDAVGALPWGYISFGGTF